MVWKKKTEAKLTVPLHVCHLCQTLTVRVNVHKVDPSAPQCVESAPLHALNDSWTPDVEDVSFPGYGRQSNLHPPSRMEKMSPEYSYGSANEHIHD